MPAAATTARSASLALSIAISRPLHVARRLAPHSLLVSLSSCKRSKLSGRRPAPFAAETVTPTVRVPDCLLRSSQLLPLFPASRLDDHSTRVHVVDVVVDGSKIIINLGRLVACLSDPAFDGCVCERSCCRESVLRVTSAAAAAAAKAVLVEDKKCFPRDCVFV